MKILLIVISVLLTFPAQAIELCKPGQQRITCVVDGDTFWYGGEKIRLKGIDTPEKGGKLCGGAYEVQLAKQATNRLRELLNGGNISINRDGKDRYGRTLATVKAHGRDVGETLVSERLARKWPNGCEWWCN